MKSGMKILITGGNCYIGTNLINLMRKGEYDVDFDICDCGIGLPLAEYLTFDYIKEYDGIIHLAALSGIAACEKDGMDAVIKNVLTSINVFKQALRAKIPVVFTSSQAAKDPQSSIYANLKWTSEMMAKFYNTLGGENYVLRLSNVYGGYDYLAKKQTCVKQFITRYRDGLPLIIHGNGEQIRDFIHVFDVCDAIINCFIFRYLGVPTEYKSKKIEDPIDIGTGRVISIMELQAMFPSRETQPIDFEFKKIRNVGAASSIADVSKARKLMDFEAQREIEDYIEEMI